MESELTRSANATHAAVVGAAAGAQLAVLGDALLSIQKDVEARFLASLARTDVGLVDKMIPLSDGGGIWFTAFSRRRRESIWTQSSRLFPPRPVSVSTPAAQPPTHSPSSLESLAVLCLLPFLVLAFLAAEGALRLARALRLTTWPD